MRRAWTALSRVSATWPVALALLALPNCALTHATVSPNNTSVVFCDLVQPGGLRRHCATMQDLAIGLPLSSGAVALYENRQSRVGIDYSNAARTRCGGQPEAVFLSGPFPDGNAVCLNCARDVGSGLRFATPLAACVNTCQVNFDGSTATPHTAAAIAFCGDLTNARVSTNTPPDGGGACIEGACTSAGMLQADFGSATHMDPRRAPQPVIWRDLVGTEVVSGLLRSTTPTPADPQAFPAGADSAAVITQGDAYFEFTANEHSGTTRVIGLSEGPPDSDTSYQNITYGIDLFHDGCYYIFEHGTPIGGSLLPQCAADHAQGTYTTGQWFRISVTDNHDDAQTATIRYFVMLASCTDPAMCPSTELASNPHALYPLRVDVSFHEFGGTVTDARLVYIH